MTKKEANRRITCSLVGLVVWNVNNILKQVGAFFVQGIVHRYRILLQGVDALQLLGLRFDPDGVYGAVVGQCLRH